MQPTEEGLTGKGRTYIHTLGFSVNPVEVSFMSNAPYPLEGHSWMLDGAFVHREATTTLRHRTRPSSLKILVSLSGPSLPLPPAPSHH